LRDHLSIVKIIKGTVLNLEVHHKLSIEEVMHFPYSKHIVIGWSDSP